MRPSHLACGLGLLMCGSAAFAAGPQSLPKEPNSIFAVTQDHTLIHFDPASPSRIERRATLTGLPAGDTLRGIDFRVSHGVLYALADSGQLYTIDTASGTLTPVGDGSLPVSLPDSRVGFDFNPAADRIRVVAGHFNLRLHPDTGAAVDFAPDAADFQPDGALEYGAEDPHSGRRPDIIAAGYTYNADNEKLTTNYAIDAALGTLVMQGSHEDTQPAVSPNLGILTTVGELGTGPLTDAHLDISDITNTALAALTPEGGRTKLYRIDLDTGVATAIGPIGTGDDALLGIAIEP